MRYFIYAFFLILTAACTSGNCRAQREADKIAGTAISVVSEEKLQSNTNNKTKLWIYKYDGSLQCGQGKAISLAEMQKSLATIKVFNSESKVDNLMHVQACGTPTGRANVYEIDISQLEEAKKKGFKEWTFD